MDRPRLELGLEACKATVLPLSLSALIFIKYIYNLNICQDFLIHLNIIMKERIPLNLRRRVIERDGYYCVYCDEDLHEKEIHMDHVIPESQGGKTTFDNLQVTCRKCNLAKGVLSESEFMSRLRRRAQRILERLGPG